MAPTFCVMPPLLAFNVMLLPETAPATMSDSVPVSVSWKLDPPAWLAFSVTLPPVAESLAVTEPLVLRANALAFVLLIEIFPTAADAVRLGVLIRLPPKITPDVPLRLTLVVPVIDELESAILFGDISETVAALIEAAAVSMMFTLPDMLMLPPGD